MIYFLISVNKLFMKIVDIKSGLYIYSLYMIYNVFIYIRILFYQNNEFTLKVYV